MFIFPSPAAMSQGAELPVYDFWDDSPFDDIRWDFYKGSLGHKLNLNLTSNVEPEACVKSCLANDNCVSIYYHRINRECEIMTFIRMNDFERGRPFLLKLPGNRLFRYIPSIPGKSCLRQCVFVCVWGWGDERSVCVSTHARTRCTLKSCVCVCILLKSCCLLYTSPSPRDISGSRMPSSA